MTVKERYRAKLSLRRLQKFQASQRKIDCHESPAAIPVRKAKMEWAKSGRAFAFKRLAAQRTGWRRVFHE